MMTTKAMKSGFKSDTGRTSPGPENKPSNFILSQSPKKADKSVDYSQHSEKFLLRVRHFASPCSKEITLEAQISNVQIISNAFQSHSVYWKHLQ